MTRHSPHAWFDWLTIQLNTELAEVENAEKRNNAYKEGRKARRV